MVHANVLIQSWIIHPIYIYWFFDSSGKVLVLPPYYAETFNGWCMICILKMIINREGGLYMFLETLSKCSWWFTNIPITTVHSWSGPFWGAGTHYTCKVTPSATPCFRFELLEKIHTQTLGIAYLILYLIYSGSNSCTYLLR